MRDIELIDTGEHYSCEDGETFLAGMERLRRRGIPVGCRGGGCGVCKVRVIVGSYKAFRMSAAHVSSDDRANNIVLACRAVPTGPASLQVEGGMRKSFLKHSPLKAGHRE